MIHVPTDLEIPGKHPDAPGASLRSILATITPTSLSMDTPEPLPARVWAASDLWHGIPTEFHGAELSRNLLATLNAKPAPTSFAILGPPGVGKTRTLWAMVHSLRKATHRESMGEPVECLRILAEGESSSRLETPAESIARTLAMTDRLRIITEVGDIRANRYDREHLAAWVRFPHWLAVDDIAAVEPNEWVREAIYHLANERRGAGRTTVWTSNLTPTQLRETFGGAIASRILGGVVIEPSGEDRRIVQ